MIRPSINKYIFRQFFSISVLTIISLVVLVEFMSDDLEIFMTELVIDLEKKYYQTLIGTTAQAWNSTTTIAAYIPDRVHHFSNMPSIFLDLPVPFSGEIELPGSDYWVNISRTKGGILYIARNTEPFELREEVFLMGIIFVGVLFIIISYFLTQLSTRRITRPIVDLIHEIGKTTPDDISKRIADNYRDQEIYLIATTINNFLDLMQDYVKREHLLVSMASHELRTPIAIITGALDVINQRDLLNTDDKRTFNRIRIATTEMSANVEAILMLSRKQAKPNNKTQFLLGDMLESAVQERIIISPEDSSRLNIGSDKINHKLVTDAVLVKMLLRNLIQNALDHTQGIVTLQQNEQGLLISDQGSGLPANVKSRIFKNPELLKGLVNESGVGLFIVKLICEHLNWYMYIDDNVVKGTKIQLRF